MAEYLKIPEVARRLDISEKTARRYIKSGVLPSTFIGGAYRVTEEDLEEFLHRAEVKPEDASPKAPAPSPEPTLFKSLEDERRTPSLQSWVLFVETLNESWGPKIERYTQEISDGERAVRRIKRLTATAWGAELHQVYGAIVESVLQDPLFPDAYGAGEHARLWRALRDMKELLDRTDSWYERGAQVADIRQAKQRRAERIERELGAYAS